MKAESQEKISEPKTEKHLLNEAQRKSLSIALKMIEERLFVFRMLMEQDGYLGTMYRFRVNLAPEEKKAITQLFDRTLKNIAALKSKFGLKAVTEELTDQIMGTVTYLWTVLEDEKSRKLKRYGSVHPELKKALDPALQKIIDDLNEISRRLS